MTLNRNPSLGRKPMRSCKWLVTGLLGAALVSGPGALAQYPTPHLGAGTVIDGITSTGAPNTTCNSAGQNSTQSPATGTLCITVNAPVTASMLQSNYAPIVANIYSANNAAGIGAVVGVYAHAVSGPNSTQVWSFNPILDIFPGSSSGGIVDEMDLNNWRCDPGNIDAPIASCPISAIGTLYEGASPYASQSAIQISGVSQAAAQWHQGISAVGAHVIDYATFYQNDGALFGYVDKGAHVGNLIQLAGSSQNAALAITTTAPVGIQLNGYTGAAALSFAAGQAATWTGGALGNVNLTVSATTGDMIVNVPMQATTHVATGASSAAANTALLGQNCSAGQAEACIVNQGSTASNGTQGFSVYQEGVDNLLANAVKILGVDKAGNLTVPGMLTGSGVTFGATTGAKITLYPGQAYGFGINPAELTTYIASNAVSALRTGSVAGPVVQTTDASGNFTTSGAVKPGSYTVAALPAGCIAGQMAYASNGRNPSEAAGAGTGTTVFCNSASHWFATSSGAAVTN